MTCADARHRILAADIAALRDESDRVLRAHLAACPACAADALRVLTETRRLRDALTARTRQPAIPARRRRAAFALVPIGLAAAITMMVVAPHRREIPSTSVTTTVVSHGDSDVVSAAGAAVTLVASTAAARVAKTGSRRANERAVHAVPAGATARNTFAEQPGSEVGVTIGEDQRATIISTSNPKVTVVWLSRGQQP